MMSNKSVRPMLRESSILDGCYFHISSDSRLLREVQRRMGSDSVSRPQNLPMFIGVNTIYRFYGVRKLNADSPKVVQEMLDQCDRVGSTYDRSGVVCAPNMHKMCIDIHATSEGAAERVRDRFDLKMKGKRMNVLSPEEFKAPSITSHEDVVSVIGGDLFVQAPRGHFAVKRDNDYVQSFRPYLESAGISYHECADFALVRPFYKSVQIKYAGVRVHKLVQDVYAAFRSTPSVRFVVVEPDDYSITVIGVDERLVDAVCDKLRDTQIETPPAASPGKRKREGHSRMREAEDCDRSEEHFLAY